MQFQQLVANNQLFALLAKLLEGGKSLLVAFAVITFYSSEAFGTFSLAIAIGSILALIAEFRLMGILVRLLSHYPRQKEKILAHAVFINFVFAGIGLLAVVLSFAVLENLLFQCLLIYSLSFLFKFGRCVRAELISSQCNNKVAIAEVLAGAVMLLATITVVFLEADIRWVVAARTLDFLVLSLLFVYFAKVSLAKLVCQPRSARLIGFLINKSLPLVLSGAAMLIFQRVDLLAISAYLGVEQAGVYAAATTIATVFSLSAIVFSESLAPQLFKNKPNNALEPNSELNFGRLVLGVGLTMSLLCFVSANLIVTWLLPAEYSAALDVLIILSVSPLFIALGAFAGQVIIKHRLERFVFKKSLIACVVTLVLNVIFIPVWGLVGGAFATACGLLIANYVSHFFIKELRPVFNLQNQVFASYFRLKAKAVV